MILTRSDMRIVEVVVGFVCNKCGTVYTVGEVKNAEEGLIGCEIAAGYGACHLTDGIKYTFSICEKCLSELFDTFTVPVQQVDCNPDSDVPESALLELFGDLPDGPLPDTPVTFTAEEVAGWCEDDT